MAWNGMLKQASSTSRIAIITRKEMLNRGDKEACIGVKEACIGVIPKKFY